MGTEASDIHRHTFVTQIERSAAAKYKVLSELFRTKVKASLQTYHFTPTMIMTKISCRGHADTVISTYSNLNRSE